MTDVIGFAFTVEYELIAGKILPASFMRWINGLGTKHTPSVLYD